MTNKICAMFVEQGHFYFKNKEICSAYYALTKYVLQ